MGLTAVEAGLGAEDHALALDASEMGQGSEDVAVDLAHGEVASGAEDLGLAVDLLDLEQGAALEDVATGLLTDEEAAVAEGASIDSSGSTVLVYGFDAALGFELNVVGLSHEDDSITAEGVLVGAGVAGADHAQVLERWLSPIPPIPGQPKWPYPPSREAGGRTLYPQGRP